MAHSYYECHITMLGAPETIRPLVEGLKWKFSSINGDPVLGDGLKCYATMLYNAKRPQAWVLDTLQDAAEKLVSQGVNVIRRKVESVIFDDRSKDVSFQCVGGCPSCHLDDYKRS